MGTVEIGQGTPISCNKNNKRNRKKKSKVRRRRRRISVVNNEGKAFTVLLTCC